MLDGLYTQHMMNLSLQKDVSPAPDEQPHNPYTEVQILYHHHTDIIRMLTRLDHYRCASAGDDCLIYVWDVVSGCRMQRLVGHSRPVTSMCVLEGGHDLGRGIDSLVLLSGASDRSVCMWNVDLGACLQKLKDAEGPVRCLVSLREQQWFAGGGENLCLWDHQGNLLHLHKRKDTDDIQGLIVMRDELFIASVDTKLVVYTLTSELTSSGDRWCIELHKMLEQHRESISALVRINGGCFASASLDGTINIWALSGFSRQRQFNVQSNSLYPGVHKTYPFSVQHIQVVAENYLFVAIGCGFHVYDTMCNKLVLAKNNAHHSKILHLALTYNEYLLVTCSEDSSIRVWSCVTAPTSLSHQNTTSNSDHPNDMNVFEKFFGKSKDEMKNIKKPLEPHLLGECLGHSAAVQRCLDFGSEGFLSCGMDGLLVSWKDGMRQGNCRTQLMQDLTFTPGISGPII